MEIDIQKLIQYERKTDLSANMRDEIVHLISIYYSYISKNYRNTSKTVKFRL